MAPAQQPQLKNIHPLIPFLAGLGIGFIAALLLPQPVTGKFYELAIVCLVLTLWGFSGLIIFLRRELLQAGKQIKGKAAMLYGLFMMAVCWSLALIFIFMSIHKSQ